MVIFGPFWHNYAKASKNTQNQYFGALLVANGLLNSYIWNFIQIEHKMTELWAKTHTPIFGHITKFYSNRPINWSNVNIFERDQFYMKGKPKLQILWDAFFCIFQFFYLKFSGSMQCLIALGPFFICPDFWVRPLKSATTSKVQSRALVCWSTAISKTSFTKISSWTPAKNNE